jgi:protein-disulfide isomerase
MSSRAQQKAQAREARLAAERAAEQAATRRRRLMLFFGILASAAVVLVVAVLVSQSGTEADTTPDERVAMFDGIPQDGTLLGASDAPVVVEEYADLQCPFCAEFATDELPAIVADYVRPGRVQLDLKVLTFLGEDSVEAGRFAAAAAQQDRQWQFTEAFYGDQGAENTGYVTEEFLRDTAAKVPGLDADKAFDDQATGAVTRQLTDATRAAAKARVESTPTFRVGRRGGELETVTSDGLRAAIDRALQQP